MQDVEEPPFNPDYAPYDAPAETDRETTAEQAVLGAMLISTTAITAVRNLLEPNSFWDPKHESIFDAITALADAGQPVDLITVAAELERRGELRRIGGAPYLHTLSANVPIAANADYYAGLVRDKARIRTIDTVANRLRHIANTGDIHELEKAFDQAYQALDTAVAQGWTTGTKNNSGLRDLSWLLTGQAPTQPPPAYTHRTDGHALFYAAKVNGVFGDPESGKTWLAQTAIVEALNAGGTAAMIDVDHNGPDHTAARLLLLGAHTIQLSDPNRFRYYEPEDNNELLAAVDDITRWAPSVYVLDSIGEVLPMMGVKSIDNDEITAALRRTCLPPASAGSCVITIDHLPKNADARGSGYAIGGTAKKRMMRGAYLRVEVRTQPAPGQIGRSTIRIEKDTGGELRKVTPGGYVGTFILDSTLIDYTRWSIERDNAPVDPAGHFRPTQYMERISRHVEDNDQATFNDIKRSLGGKDSHLRTAIKILIAEGFMTTITGPRNSTLHHSISHYREAEDDTLNPTL